MRITKIAVPVLILLCFVLSGCATYKVQNVRLEPVESYLYRKSIGDVTVALDPFDTADKAKSAFYVDLTSKNIRPINLIIDNRSKDELLIIRSGIKVEDSSGNSYQPVSSDYVFSKFEKNELMYAFWGFGIFSYMSAEEANRKMKDDWFKKEFPEEKVIPSDRKVAGFVFFELAQHYSGCNVKVPIKNLRTGEKAEVIISLK